MSFNQNMRKMYSEKEIEKLAQEKVQELFESGKIGNLLFSKTITVLHEIEEEIGTDLPLTDIEKTIFSKYKILKVDIYNEDEDIIFSGLVTKTNLPFFLGIGCDTIGPKSKNLMIDPVEDYINIIFYDGQYLSFNSSITIYVTPIF